MRNCCDRAVTRIGPLRAGSTAQRFGGSFGFGFGVGFGLGTHAFLAGFTLGLEAGGDGFAG